MVRDPDRPRHRVIGSWKEPQGTERHSRSPSASNPATKTTVAVAIPTRNRPELLRRALDSVLAQTFQGFELHVVVDGPDARTEAVLAAEADKRLHVHIHSAPRGGAAARNTAVRMSTARWVAFLDDDDEWLPQKLERQVPPLADLAGPLVSFTRLIAQAPHGSYVWPRRAPRDGEHISEYLFVRGSMFAGENGVQTSTIVAPRQLLLAHPFDESLVRLQDTDWLLRVARAGARLDFCPSALTIWHIEERRSSITGDRRKDWRLLFDWISARRHLVTPRAYAAFLLVRGGAATAASLEFRGGVAVWREALRNGSPGTLDILLFVSRWLVPPAMRRTLRSWFSPWKVRDVAR
jgi:glycosyltransferase involved in cell wall biosynthesis